jgi:hypothetical protein
MPQDAVFPIDLILGLAALVVTVGFLVLFLVRRFRRPS